MQTSPSPSSHAPDATAGRSALLAGATGLVGGFCLEELLASPRYRRVVVLVRRPFPHSHPKLQTLVTAFDPPDALGDAPGVDDVFCCLGTTIRRAGSQEAFRRVDYELPLALARATRLRGATQFVLVSSYGADPDSRTFYLRVKGEVEQAIDAVGFPTFTVLRPSLLLGPRRERRFGELAGKVVGRIVAPLLRGPLAGWRPVQAETVARAMVRSATRGLTGRNILAGARIQEVSSGPP